VRFLPQSSQSWKPFRSLVDRNGQPLVATAPLLLRTESDLRKRTTAPPSDLNSAQRLALDHLASSILLQEHPPPSLLEVRVRDFISGLIGPLLKPVMSPVADTMGNMVAGITADAMMAPVGQQVGAGIVAKVVDGLQPYLTNELVQTIVPALTETTADSVTDTVSNVLSDYLTEKLTPKITGDLTKMLTESLVKPVVKSIGARGSILLASQVTYGLVLVLSKSISHSLAPALLQTMHRSPLDDYYCYRCSKHQDYCSYCHASGPTQGQLYYALYYTGYYSQYYGQYYADFFDKHPAIKLVKKKPVQSDPVDSPFEQLPS